MISIFHIKGIWPSTGNTTVLAPFFKTLMLRITMCVQPILKNEPCDKPNNHPLASLLFQEVLNVGSDLCTDRKKPSTNRGPISCIHSIFRVHLNYRFSWSSSVSFNFRTGNKGNLLVHYIVKVQSVRI